MAPALILDFDGVCTRSARELTADSASDGSELSGSIADIIRPEAVAAMTTAKAAGMTTVVLSNDLDRSWLDGLELEECTDHVIVGSDNGIFKPDRRAFQRCLLVADCRPEWSLVVDDQADNIAVADSLGIRTVLFDTESPSAISASWAIVHRHIDDITSEARSQPPEGQR